MKYQNLVKYETEYYSQLNSLRGFAAISVIFWHYWQCYDDNLSKLFRPYLFFTYGTGAVILFFVLSGFVLSVSYRSNSGYLDYLFRRIFRIYPAYYLAVLISIIGFIILNPRSIQWLSRGFNYWHNATLDFKSMINILVLINPWFFNLFDTPAWTLSVEMIVSIFFPLFLFLLNLRFGNYIGILYIFIVLYYKWLLNATNAFFLPINYSIYFVIGILLANNWKKLSYLGGIWLLPIYIYCYSNPYFLPQFLIGFLKDPLTGLGASGIILVSLHSKGLIKFLNLKYFQLIGKLSYSIYLFHMPVVLILVYLLQKKLNRTNLFYLYPVCFVFTIFLSYFSYKFIEKPSINLGRKLYKKLVLLKAL